mmetsp:Transcript_108782/g.307573  ORF Transcript_108782/g.307573 Transcript_108782/m.307573 type:complete len:213 (+) Transcript_108782:740-1378(+)
MSTTEPAPAASSCRASRRRPCSPRWPAPSRCPWASSCRAAASSWGGPCGSSCKTGPCCTRGASSSGTSTACSCLDAVHFPHSSALAPPPSRSRPPPRLQQPSTSGTGSPVRTRCPWARLAARGPTRGAASSAASPRRPAARRSRGAWPARSTPSAGCRAAGLGLRRKPQGRSWSNGACRCLRRPGSGRQRQIAPRRRLASGTVARAVLLRTA